jgi:hypothetical protein
MAGFLLQPEAILFDLRILEESTDFDFFDFLHFLESGEGLYF